MRVNISALEPRRLLADTPFAVIAGTPLNQTLVVTGSSGDDVITVAPNPTINQLDATLNGATLSFDALHISEIDINSGDGDDQINIQSSKGSRVNAGPGNDSVLCCGGPSTDQVNGGAGDDLIDGGSGIDILNGGDGNDTLLGRSGNDDLDGGAGTDLIDGGSDPTDFVNYTGRSDDLTISLDGAANDGAPGENDQIINIERVLGGDGNDSITGNGKDNLMLGGDGNDTLVGAAGNDAFNGESGNDLILGGSGNDRLTDALDGNDTLMGQAGNDQLLAGAGDDLLDGGSGNDTLLEEAGADTLRGQAGSDTIDSDDTQFVPAAPDADADIYSGGSGHDEIALFTADFNQQLITLDGVANDYLDGHDNVGADFEVIRLGGSGGTIDASMVGHRVELVGEPLSDTLIGGSSADLLKGGDGNDSLVGNGGEDVLRGQNGPDTLVGGPGPDSFNGGPDNDLLVSNDNGPDTVNGDLGRDTAQADVGTDTLIGVEPSCNDAKVRMQRRTWQEVVTAMTNEN